MWSLHQQEWRGHWVVSSHKNQPGWPSDWAKWEVSIHQMWLQSHLGDCSYNFLDELLWITSLKLMRKSATGVRSTSHVMGLVIISVEENYWGPDVGHVECECWEVSPLLITNLITPVIPPATVTNQTASLEVRDSNVAFVNLESRVDQSTIPIQPPSGTPRTTTLRGMVWVWYRP